jgi:phospholipid/cholesterol/gamma-HCH transport system substrate-binding protein
MDRDRRLSLTVGGLALVSVFVLVVAILSLSSQQGVWTPHYRLVAHFDNVQGLIGGSPVWLAGTHVGRVEGVAFDAAGADRQVVKVVMQIDESVQERIRSDSVATIGTIGLLGDRYVEVSVGTQEGEILQDGDELRSLSPVDLSVVITKGARALDNIADLTSSLNSVVAEFERGEGGQKLADSVAVFGDVMVEVQEGEGLLHSLIYDQYQGSGVESIERSLATLEDILHEVRHGGGILHSLVYDTPTEQDVVLEVLQAGSRLNSILAKIDRGEGTFGLMLNDPTLYEELKLLVGGAGRSRVVRTLIGLVGSEEE